MKVGIIGAGQIAEVHGPLILKQRDAEIIGIADTNIQRAETLARELKVAPVYQDAKTMISEQKPDVVHVLVPPQYHAEVSITAMKQGCHVLVEKPMALTVAEAKQMIEIAKQNKVCLCVDHNPLFDPPFRQAIKEAAAGIIGQVISVEAYEVYDVARAPAFTANGAERTHWCYRTNGGPLQDMLPHPAALILEFIPEVKELQLIGFNRGTFPQAWQDELRVLVKSDTVSGYMYISANERPDACTLTIRGTKGVLHADSYNQILTIRRVSRLSRKAHRGLDGFRLACRTLSGSVGNVFKTAMGRMDKANGIDTLISELYKSIRQGGESPVSPESGLRVVDLMNKVWPAPRVVTK